MIDKLLAPVLDVTGKAVVKGANALGKDIVGHFTKHATKYISVVATVATNAAIYAVGHLKGKKEGTTEQAARDENKIKNMHQQHENDRKQWNEEKQAYEDLLNETENKL